VLLLVVVVAAGVLAVATYGAWRNYRDSRPAAVSFSPVSASARTASFARAELIPDRAGAVVPTSRLVLTAARGDSWVAVRAGSANGGRLFEGTLTRGDRISYRRDRLWIRFGLPANVDATVDGRKVPLPAGVATVLLDGARLKTVQSG
jgi:hypothetical protein